ncbi:MAG: carbohydrate kinase [Chloroflexi bacterium]|nr:carbohydrate kinase [Chloroflexota bacterium]
MAGIESGVVIREPLAIALRDAKAPLVLALDIGTSGMRGFVFDVRGYPVRSCIVTADAPLRTSPDGEATLDGDERFRATCGVIDAVLARLGRRAADLAAVAMSTFWHSLVGVDANGRATTRVLTWADTRAHGAAVALRHELDVAATHARTGCTIHASYWPAKLRYLAVSAPAAYARTAHWLSLGEMLHQRLFGDVTAGHGMASATGLYDQRRRDWDEPLIAHLRLARASLSAVGDASRIGLRPAFARRWPALARVPWLPAIGDGACSNVGAGAVGPRTSALFVGTSGALRVVFPGTEPPVVPGGWTYHLDADHLVAGGALSNGGNVVRWLGLHYPRLEPATLWKGRADASELTALPLLAGDRSPTWDDAARGAITGLSLATRPEDVARAMLEGVAYRAARLWGLVNEALPEIDTVVATGGTLLAFPWLMQLFADALDRPLVMSGSGEGSARGAAIIALARLGAIKGLTGVRSPRGRVFRPRAEAHRRLAAGMERQRQLEVALAGLRAGEVAENWSAFRTRGSQ